MAIGSAGLSLRIYPDETVASSFDGRLVVRRQENAFEPRVLRTKGTSAVGLALSLLWGKGATEPGVAIDEERGHRVYQGKRFAGVALWPLWAMWKTCGVLGEAERYEIFVMTPSTLPNDYTGGGFLWLAINSSMHQPSPSHPLRPSRLRRCVRARIALTLFASHALLLGGMATTPLVLVVRTRRAGALPYRSALLHVFPLRAVMPCALVQLFYSSSLL